MSKYFEEEQLTKYFKEKEKDIKKETKMSKLDYIIFKIEQLEKLLKSIKYNSN